MDSFLLMFHILLVLTGTCTGAFFYPTAYTLNGVMSVNGSDPTGGCPQACVLTVSINTYCDCAGTAGAGTFTGVIIDGVVPTLDTSQRGTWATQLLTIRGNSQTFRIGFQFQNAVMLREVELYLFYCPSWNISGSPVGTNTINIYNALLFPTFVDSFGGSTGNVNLTSDMANCENLISISIPIQGTRNIRFYFIEFTNSQWFIEWLHIAEVRFSDEFIPTPGPLPVTSVQPSSTAPGMSLSSLQVITTTRTTTATMVNNQLPMGGIIGLVAAIIVLLLLLLIGGVVVFLCYTYSLLEDLSLSVSLTPAILSAVITALSQLYWPQSSLWWCRLSSASVTQSSDLEGLR